MGINEKDTLYKIEHLHKYQRAYYGLVDAKFVNIRGNKICACCNKEILSGEKALTSSSPVDKQFNTSFKEAYDNNNVKKYKFVLVRQWIHVNCVDTIISKASDVEIKDRWYKRKDIDDIEIELLSFGEQVEVLKYFYEKRDINCDDFMELIGFEELDAESQLSLLKYFNEKGDIPDSEFERLENGLIDYIAFDDAMGLGQE